MKKLTAILCALVLVLSLAAVPTVAEAKGDDQLVITFANGMSETHAVNVAFTKFVQTIEEKSGGTMTGIMYPNNQLGGDVVAMQGVQDGSIVMTWTTGANQVSLVPELALFDIPFLFSDVDQANEVLNDPEFRAYIESCYENAGYKSLALDCTGFRWLSTKGKPIQTLEDLKGLKIRTMQNKYHMAFWSALGVTPTPLANSERYAALQQGTVDGQENAMENAYSTKMYEVQDTFINTRHIAYTSAWTMNKDFYDSMTDEQKAIFDEAIAVAIQEAYDATRENEEGLLKSLEDDYGCTVLRSLADGELERWAEIAQPAAMELVRQDLGDEPVDRLMEVVAAHS